MNRSSSWQCFGHFPCTVFLLNAALVIRTRTSFSVHMFCVLTHVHVHRINMFVFNRNMIVYMYCTVVFTYYARLFPMFQYVHVSILLVVVLYLHIV